MENSLVALGGAFLAAGLLARAGRRIGLPTIPLFMAAGIVFGPNTPGISLVDHPEDLELLAGLGLVLLLFTSGSSSRSTTSRRVASRWRSRAPPTSR